VRGVHLIFILTIISSRTYAQATGPTGSTGATGESGATGATGATGSQPIVVPPFSEVQIQRNIDRAGYLKDSDVIKLGIKYIEKIQTQMDLSSRSDLRKALMSVITADISQIQTVSLEAQDLAAKCLGHTKLTNIASEEIVILLQSANTKNAETAAIEYARTTKQLPTPEIMQALKNKSLNETIREIALATADHDTIHYLIEVAQAEKRYDPLYGLDSLEAAAIVVNNYLDYFNKPNAPTNLTATLTTYNSIQLSWTDTSTNEQEFEIDFAINEGNFVELTRVPGNTIYYSHQNLDPQKTYKYRVRSMNLDQNGASSNEASVTTPDKPDPMPDPPPVIPELPKSPTAAMNLADLTKRLRVYIENVPHEDSTAALIQYVKLASASAAVEASRVLKDHFDRAAFDFSSPMTSLGLRAITLINARGVAEFNDFPLPENLRREYGNTLRQNATILQERFVKDETPK
jgi:hypothetical protein